jgi:hypothetical protein
MADEDNSQKVKGSTHLAIGKEIDAALGEVIRGLLVKPSIEVGNIIADSIGIFGDKIKNKRSRNIELGMEGVREILEEKKVDLKDITPPSEEDLYIVFDGMSKSGDEELRKLWSGLLAMELDPNELNWIDRPISSAITALSPADARVIQFTAFVLKNEFSIRNDAIKAAGLEDEHSWTLDDRRLVEEERRAMRTRLEGYMAEVSKLEERFFLQNITTQADWEDNLLRLGIIQSKPEEYNPSTPRFSGFRGEVNDGKFDAILEHLEKRIQEAEGLALQGLEIEFLFKRDEEDQRVILGFQLTRFGHKLCKACGLL